MKKIDIKSLLLVFSLLALFSCGDAQVSKKRLPAGNAKEINSSGNDFAPINLPINDKIDSPCNQEFNSNAAEARDQVKPSPEYLAQMFGKETAERIEVISFLTNRSGIISVPHPPDKESAERLGIPFWGITGGTDLFEFKFENDNFVFRNFGKPINTETWDSHPCIVANEQGKLLMLWSSDRADNLGGFSSPYLLIKNLRNEDTLIGNTDIYYAFFDGTWSEPVNLKTGYINSIANDESPHLYCLCYNSKLLFSSNRNNSNIFDYDLYAANIRVDFENKNIEVLSEPMRLGDKGLEAMNTESKDFFPFIPKPYSGSDSEPNYVYFSSDRFAQEYKVDKENSIVGNGGFDIYKFPVDFPCRPPKITYIVHVLDSLNPNQRVEGAVKVELLDANKQVVSTSNQNPATFNLSYDRKYLARGTALFDAVECNGKDSVVSGYKIIHRVKVDTIVQKKIKVKYDSVIGGRTITIIDTINSSEIMHLSKLNEVSSSKDRVITKLDVRGDSVEVSFAKYEKRTEVVSGKTIVKERTEIVNEPVTRIDEIPIAGNLDMAFTLKSRRGTFPDAIFNNDITIHDTIYIAPVYFRFPPCKWEYISILDDYRKNVPYFQTGFWEVNTSANINRHVNELRSERYGDASFIELQPENKYFGYRRGNLTEEEVEKKKTRWENRVAMYRKHARQVDKNLAEMSDEITKGVLPKFKALDSMIPALNSKLIIQLEAYSDFRDIVGGKYLTQENVSYFGANFNESKNEFDRKALIEIQSGDEMDQKNEILSRLRAYFGYKELIRLLEREPIFQEYLSKGLVALPDKIKSESEFQKALASCKIIITTVGKRIDSNAISSIKAYVGEDDDYYTLDSVRRINVVVHRVQYGNGRIIKTDCCAETPLPTTTLKHQSEFSETASKELLPTTNDTKALSPSPRFYQVSCGSFEKINNANDLLDVLIKNGKLEYAIETTSRDGMDFYRVRSKYYPNIDDAKTELESVKNIFIRQSIKTDLLVMPIE